MSDNHDAFALGGDQRDNGDARVRALFQDWLKACRAADRHVDDADQAADDAALERMDEIERHISATPGGGAALAIKTYLWQRRDSGDWVPDVAMARFTELFEGDSENWEEDRVVSMLLDAAKQVPELADLAAPIIHEDAPLIDADIEIQWCQGRLAEKDPTPAARAEIRQKLKRLLERVATMEAKTPRGHAIKSHHSSGADHLPPV